MIKTVFYFTGTELEYIALHRAGEISPNTIVLCKDTHSLWRNGERYGVGSTSEGGDYVPYDDTALTERIDQIVEELQQLAEQIGQSEKGMTEEEKQLMQDLADQLIVIGDGLDTANEVAAAEKERLNGLLDGIQQSINDMLEQAEQDNASIQQLVSDVQNQAAAIQEHAEWILNREEEDSTSWKSGWNANIEAYLQEVGVWARDNGITETQFTQLSQSVDTISSSVNNLQEDVETVKTQFSNISQTADSIETRVASVEQNLDTKATKSQVSELSQTVNGFSTRVSNVETDVAGKVGNSEFSTLSQRVNSIDLAVQALTPSEDGSISEQMQATIELAVRDGVAELNLSSTYAKKSTEEDLEATLLDLENAEKVLEWMYSGLKLSTAPDKTTSELASAGKDALNNAISDLRTYVQKLKNGDYVASSSITSAVNNAIASLYSQAGNNNAKSLIFSKITSNENSISGLLNDVSDIDNTVDQIQSDLSDGLDQINQNTQDIAAIVTAATGDSTSATIATKFSNWKSGLASKSDVESATASLISSDVFDNTVADLVTKTELNQATSTLAAKTTVENQGTRLSSVETKANQNAATLTNLTKTDGRIAKVEQKATDTEAAISGLVDASTDTVTASKIWESLANDNSVISSMRSQFATTVDGDGIAALVKEDIAQSVYNSTWDQWVSYMKGDVATAVNNYQTATANKAQWDAVVAYVDGKKTAIESIDDLDDSVSNLSTSLAGVSSSVGSLEDEVTGIKNNYAQSSMFASIKDTQGKVTAASIVAAVNGSSGTSKVQIDADHIDVSGVLTVANNAASAATAAQNTANSALTAATTIDGASIKTGTINADRLDISKIVGKINSSAGDSKLVINADHVDVSGVLTVANNAATAASTAQTTANSAANAASAAQSTANSAVSAANTAQSTADGSIKAVWRIYYASNANSAPAVPSAFITDETGGYNKWTTVRPAYSQSYKYLYTATQSKTNGNTVSTTTPVLDLTTTVIDGGNIITGTVTANLLAADSVTAAKIAAGAVGANEIAANAITSAKIAAEAITADKVNLSSIVGAINDTTGTSKLVIDADHIQLNGQTVVNSINNGTTTINGGKIDTESLQVKAANISGKLTATQIDATNLQVGSTNITGLLTAEQIDADDLKINHVNVIGKMTASQIDATNLQVAAANITGKLTASQIDATDLVAVKLAATSGTIGGWTIGLGSLEYSDNNGSARIGAGTLQFGSGLNMMWINPSGIETVSGGSTTTNKINSNGSGSLASGNISWTTAGAITATNIAVNGGNIGIWTVDSNKNLVASTTNGKIQLASSGVILNTTDLTKYAYLTPEGLYLQKGAVVPTALYADGSGKLANGNIQWDTDGNISKLKTVQGTYSSTILSGVMMFEKSGSNVATHIEQTGVSVWNGSNKVAKMDSNGFDTSEYITSSSGIGVKGSNNQLAVSMSSDGSIDASGNIYTEGVIESKGGILVVDGQSILISLGDDGIIEATDVNASYVNASELSVSDSTNYVNITPGAIKVKKNGTTGTGVTQSFSIKATGTYLGQLSDYSLTLTFTNGILTGYNTNGFPGSTSV